MKKKSKSMFDIPRPLVLGVGYLIAIMLLLLGLLPNLLPGAIKNVDTFAIGIVLATVTWVYQNIENRLDDFENVVVGSSNLNCKLLQPTTSVKGEITVEKLALSCSRMILLMYFGQRRPSPYYREQFERIMDYVVRNKDLFSKNIVLATPATIDWIEWQVQHMKGVDNFSLSCFTEVTDVSVYHLGISSLIFDDKHVLLIDPGKRHGVVATERDIFFESPAINEMFSAYYNGLFSKAIPLLSQGDINHKNFDTLRVQLG